MQDQPRRLRSTAVSLGLVGALALSLSACGSTSSANTTRRCIDANNIRQTDSAYQLVGDQSCVASTAPAAGGFGTTPSYRYYYGGRVVNGYVLGGSFTVPTRAGSSSSRRWYNPGTWRSSSNSSNSSGTSSATGTSSGTTQSGVTTGGFGSSGSSGGKSGSSSS